MGAVEKNDSKGPTPSEIMYDEQGRKIVTYKHGRLRITGVVINQPSSEALDNANRVYRDLFYKLNPQDSD